MMDDDSELHFALHNTYCAEHGKRLSECISCSRIAVNAALAAERERCAQVVWECRGHCVTDDAARDLMEQVQRTP